MKMFLALLALSVFGVTSFCAEKPDLAKLQRDIEEIRTGQIQIQKDLQALTERLTGKKAPLENVFVDISGRPALGSAQAPVTIVEFTDYQCPFCAEYMRDTFPRIMYDYIQTGKVR